MADKRFVAFVLSLSLLAGLGLNTGAHAVGVDRDSRQYNTEFLVLNIHKEITQPEALADLIRVMTTNYYGIDGGCAGDITEGWRPKTPEEAKYLMIMVLKLYGKKECVEKAKKQIFATGVVSLR